MTSEAFSLFCQLARTQIGKQIRLMYYRMSVFLKELEESICKGEVQLKRTRGEEETRDIKRVKAGDLHTLCHEAVGTRANGMGHAMISGEINKASMGKYKYELARDLNMPAQKVNARDYMTRAQLSAAEFLQSALIEAANDLPEETDLVALNRKYCQGFAESWGGLIHGKVAEKSMGLSAARKSFAAIEAPSAGPYADDAQVAVAVPASASVVPVSNTIHNYFAVVNQTNQ